MWLAGIDEAGRGPCLGPLVVGVVQIPQADSKLLEDAGITDSKLLSPVRREELYDWLQKQKVTRGWTVSSMSAEPVMIDEWMAAGSLNGLEVDLFASSANLAISKKQRAERGTLVLDACDVNAPRFGDLVASRLTGWPWQNWRIISEHGADTNHAVVGAASIVAKVERDRAVNELKEELGIDIGSGYPSDPKTQRSLTKLLEGQMPHDSLRWKWKTISNAWLELKGEEVPLRGASIQKSTALESGGEESAPPKSDDQRSSPTTVTGQRNLSDFEG